MTNFEFYKDDIKAVGYDFAIVARSGKFAYCLDEDELENGCADCAFTKMYGPCDKLKIKWLYEEHEEQPKLTKNERKLCEILNECYIARNVSGDLIAYEKRPIRVDNCWWKAVSGIWWRLDITFGRFKDCNFSFIKWEDEEPWSVEDLLKLEVAE